MPPAARVGDMHTCPMQTPGTLDDKGFARVDGIDPGTCKITLIDIKGGTVKIN